MNNSAGSDSGAVRLDSSSLILSDCVFKGNTSGSTGVRSVSSLGVICNVRAVAQAASLVVAVHLRVIQAPLLRF